MLVNFKPIYQQGYSLIELVITIVLSSIALLVFLTLFSSIQSSSTEPVFQVKAAELGQAYLEEIGLKRFDEQSPAGNGLRCNDPAWPTTCSLVLDSEGGEVRATFDDIDDYNGLIDSPPQDAFGNARSGFTSFSVNIVVAYSGADFGFPNQDLKRITVTVTTPDSTSYQFSQYKGNF
ncbi:MAG: prepilin-type N-terminal cleavage/methylation domain-containing protein [Kangiellaceae bacterium]|nr:prepilin-type N-terminal cleavage/methylation domain-containing protein [Kangiellaceae bacterium]